MVRVEIPLRYRLRHVKDFRFGAHSVEVRNFPIREEVIVPICRSRHSSPSDCKNPPQLEFMLPYVLPVPGWKEVHLPVSFRRADRRVNSVRPCMVGEVEP